MHRQEAAEAAGITAHVPTVPARARAPVHVRAVEEPDVRQRIFITLT